MDDFPKNHPDSTFAFSKDQWLKIASELLDIGPYLQAALEKLTESNPELSKLFPALDPDVFELDVRAAVAAIGYIAEFCPDKCRFVPVEEE